VKIQVTLDSGRTLSFEAPGDVKVGDRAECPINEYWNGGMRYRTGTVVSLESNYEGACNKVRLLR
jgi:hypothetical protein